MVYEDGQTVACVELRQEEGLMVRLQELAQKTEEHFHLTARGDYDKDRLIYRVEILSAETAFDENTLYLAGEGRGFPRPPEGMECCLMAAETAEMPGVSDVSVMPFQRVRLNRQPPPGRLFCFLQEQLRLWALIENQSNRLYHTLYRGKGLKDVLALAETFLGYPISICDASYNMIEISPLMKKMAYGKMAYGMEHSPFRSYLADVDVESMKRNRIMDRIQHSAEAFGLRTADHPDSLWIYCGIRIQKVMIGYVAVCMGDEGQNEYVLRMTTILADICAIEMQKHDFFVTRTGMRYENFLVDLLEGHFNDVNRIRTRLELLDRKFCKYFCLVVLACMEPHDSRLFNRQQMAALRAAYPNSMSLVYRDAIVLFLNQEQPIRFQEAFTEKLLEFSALNHMKAGISQPFEDILRIRDFYIQAVNALELGEQVCPEQPLRFAAGLLPQYLFKQADVPGLYAGIHYQLLHLQNYDREFHTEFVPTLRAYLDNDRNAARAAGALHIHRSTFFYRMKKIEELLDISITDSRLLFLFELSFRIWDYLR